jgi:hypothetical protein
MHQRLEAGLDTRRPGRCVAQLGRAGRAGRVAGGALALVDLFAGTQGAVGVTHFHGADLLDALGDGQLGVAGAGGGLVASGHVEHQSDDGEDREHKRKDDGDQELLGVRDRPGVRFFVGDAHEILW